MPWTDSDWLVRCASHLSFHQIFGFPASCISKEEGGGRRKGEGEVEGEGGGRGREGGPKDSRCMYCIQYESESMYKHILLLTTALYPTTQVSKAEDALQ